MQLLMVMVLIPKTGLAGKPSSLVRIFPFRFVSPNLRQPIEINSGRIPLRRVVIIAALVFLLSVVGAQAQQIDIGFGVSGLSSPSSTPSAVFTTPSLGGGTYVGFNGDFLVHKDLGVQGEIFWRAHQGLYNGYQPYRPLFWDFNGMWLPHLARHVSGEFVAGIGATSIRFYNNYYTCSYITGCTNYTSSNHFMGDFGAGIRFYPHGNIFIRPEARLYLIHNNVEFNSNHATRYGVTIGYTFGER